MTASLHAWFQNEVPQKGTALTFPTHPDAMSPSPYQSCDTSLPQGVQPDPAETQPS